MLINRSRDRTKAGRPGYGIRSCPTSAKTGDGCYLLGAARCLAVRLIIFHVPPSIFSIAVQNRQRAGKGVGAGRINVEFGSAPEARRRRRPEKLIRITGRL